MALDPLVSIVVTCYNYGKYLSGCLDSLLAQTLDRYEIIVVNDGSTDNTEEVIAPYLQLSNLTYIKQGNSGQARAKNVGIENARGEFIAFLDADDLWKPDKLLKQMDCFRNPKVGVVYCRADYIDEDQKEILYEMTAPYLQPRRGVVTDWLFLDNFIPFSSSVVRTACLHAFGGFDETLKMGIDWDLWLRISTAYEFDWINERLFSYRMGHSGQMSKNLEVRQRCSDQIMAKFLNSYPQAVSPSVVQRAYYYTFCNRGAYYRTVDKKTSYGFFLRAIRMCPFSWGAYKGLIKNLVQAG